MYKITVNWYENYCQIDESSDFYDELFNKIGPIYNTSKEEIERLKLINKELIELHQ